MHMYVFTFSMKTFFFEVPKSEIQEMLHEHSARLLQKIIKRELKLKEELTEQIILKVREEFVKSKLQ